MTPGIVGVFDQQVGRIKRIVEAEFTGASVTFDQKAWPMIRLRVLDAQGVTVSRPHPGFTLAELDDLSDRRLRSTIRRLCGHSK
jgi:hypothetical protein